jgi:CBS domain-containing protein
MRVADVMTADVYTTTPETPIRTFARRLGEHGIAGMPVLDDDGSVIGVISEADVLAKARREPEDAGPSALARLLHPRPTQEALKRDARLVGEAMTAPPVTIESYCSLATAAARMLEHDVNRLPVIQRGKLVGIVSRADIVRAFARSDDRVLAEVREQVELHQALNGESELLEVDVKDGEAVLTGAMRRRSDAEALSRLVRMVPGVVDVRSELSWSEDD